MCNAFPTFGSKQRRQKILRLSANAILLMVLTNILMACGGYKNGACLLDEGQFLDAKPPGISDFVIHRIKSATIGDSFLPGTAFYITPDYLALTNYHVIYPCIKNHYSEIYASPTATRLSSPIDCGHYSIVAIPPDPYQLTLQVGFYGDVFHANEFLDWKKTRLNKNLTKAILEGETEAPDWALIRIKHADDAPPSSFLTLTETPNFVDRKLIGYGWGINAERFKNRSLADLEFLKTIYEEFAHKYPESSKLIHYQLKQISQAMDFRRHQDSIPASEREFPDPTSGVPYKAPKFAVGSIMDSGNYVKEWQTDLSIEYLRAIWRGNDFTESALENDERASVWLGAGAAATDIADLLKSYLSDINALKIRSRSDELNQKIEWRIKNLEARARTDLSDQFYRFELQLLKACQNNPASPECSQGVDKIASLVRDNVILFKTSAPTSEQLSFLDTATIAVQGAETSFQHLGFNGKGFVSNVDMLAGNSGSPLVDATTGEVVGIHRAGPWNSEKTYGERRIHVDIQQVKKSLTELGFSLPKNGLTLTDDGVPETDQQSRCRY